MDIPGFGHAEVRHGTVRKKSFRLFAKRSDKPTPFAGYVVTITDPAGESQTCRLFRLPDGTWSTDVDGIGKLDSEMLLATRSAIQRYEHDFAG